VDDWNFDDVRLGTKKAITDLNMQTSFSIETSSPLDGSHATVA
jgi:hypothetical protein